MEGTATAGMNGVRTGERVVETIRRYKVKIGGKKYRVRVWRQVDSARPPQDHGDVIAALDQKFSDLEQVVEILASLPHVNAVEVGKGKRGPGVVVYNNWP